MPKGILVGSALAALNHVLQAMGGRNLRVAVDPTIVDIAGNNQDLLEDLVSNDAPQPRPTPRCRFD